MNLLEIEKRIDSYKSHLDAFDKVIRVIKSCDTLDQWRSAQNMGKLFRKQYGFNAWQEYNMIMLALGLQIHKIGAKAVIRLQAA